METTLGNILGKLNDYKICKECKAINWYENDECRNCPQSMEFFEDEKIILKWCKDEYKFYMKTEKYTESETDDILVDI